MAETKLQNVSRKFEVETNIEFKELRRSFSNEPTCLTTEHGWWKRIENTNTLVVKWRKQPPAYRTQDN